MLKNSTGICIGKNPLVFACESDEFAVSYCERASVFMTLDLRFIFMQLFFGYYPLPNQKLHLSTAIKRGCKNAFEKSVWLFYKTAIFWKVLQNWQGGRRLFCKTALFRKCKIGLHEKRCSTPPHSLQDRLSMPGEGGRKLFLVNGIIAISSLPLSRFWPVSTL